MADTLALPLIVDASGQLRRENTADAIVRLIGVMASTHSSFWPHAPWFGLRELFEDSMTDTQELPQLVDAINAALLQLGTDTVSVSTVRNALGQYGERHFDIMLTEVNRAPIVRQLKT